MKDSIWLAIGLGLLAFVLGALVGASHSPVAGVATTAAFGLAIPAFNFAHSKESHKKSNEQQHLGTSSCELAKAGEAASSIFSHILYRSLAEPTQGCMTGLLPSNKQENFRGQIRTPQVGRYMQSIGLWFKIIFSLSDIHKDKSNSSIQFSMLLGKEMNQKHPNHCPRSFPTSSLPELV